MGFVGAPGSLSVFLWRFLSALDGRLQSATGLTVWLVSMTLLLAGCGGGEGVSRRVESVNAGSFEPVLVSVTDRAPLAGAVIDIQCNGESYAATTDTWGSVFVLMNTKLAPCLGRATSADGLTVYHGIFLGSDGRVVSVTPLSDLVLTASSGRSAASAFEQMQSHPDEAASWLFDTNRRLLALNTILAALKLGDTDDVAAYLSMRPISSSDPLTMALQAIQDALDARRWTLRGFGDALLQLGQPSDLKASQAAGAVIAGQARVDEFWQQHFALLPSSDGSGYSVLDSTLSSVGDAQRVKQVTWWFDPVSRTYKSELRLCQPPTQRVVDPKSGRVLPWPGSASNCGFDTWPGAVFGPASSGSPLRTVTLDLAEGFSLRFRAEDLGAPLKLAGAPFSNFDATASLSAEFDASSKAYSSALVALDAIQLTTPGVTDSATYSSLTDFKAAHTSDLVCGGWPSTSDGRRFGLTFDATDPSRASLWLLQPDQCLADDQYAPLPVTVSAGSLGPLASLELSLSLISIETSVAVKPLPLMPEVLFTIWGATTTPNFKVIYFLNESGELIGSINLAAGTRFDLRPANMFYLNRSAVNSVLRAAGQPELLP